MAATEPPTHGVLVLGRREEAQEALGALLVATGQLVPAAPASSPAPAATAAAAAAADGDGKDGDDVDAWGVIGAGTPAAETAAAAAALAAVAAANKGEVKMQLVVGRRVARLCFSNVVAARDAAGTAPLVALVFVPVRTSAEVALVAGTYGPAVARSTPPGTPWLLVGSRCSDEVDGRAGERVLTLEEGIVLAERCGAAAYLECSAATLVGVQAVLEHAARLAEAASRLTPKQLAKQAKKRSAGKKGKNKNDLHPRSSSPLLMEEEAPRLKFKPPKSERKRGSAVTSAVKRAVRSGSSSPVSSSSASAAAEGTAAGGLESVSVVRVASEQAAAARAMEEPRRTGTQTGAAAVRAALVGQPDLDDPLLAPGADALRAAQVRLLSPRPKGCPPGPVVHQDDDDDDDVAVVLGLAAAGGGDNEEDALGGEARDARPRAATGRQLRRRDLVADAARGLPNEAPPQRPFDGPDYGNLPLTQEQKLAATAAAAAASQAVMLPPPGRGRDYGGLPTNQGEKSGKEEEEEEEVTVATVAATRDVSTADAEVARRQEEEQQAESESAAAPPSRPTNPPPSVPSPAVKQEAEATAKKGGGATQRLERDVEDEEGEEEAPPPPVPTRPPPARKHA